MDVVSPGCLRRAEELYVTRIGSATMGQLARRVARECTTPALPPR